jgi:2-iminobutanoate/2-iminopropanoate deaminase
MKTSPMAKAVSQLLWSHKDREKWFSLGENHVRRRSFGLHPLRNRCERALILAGLLAVFTSGGAFAQNQAIGFTKGMPFSDAFIAGNTLYVAGQQGPDEHGNVTGTDITFQTKSAIAVVKKVVEKAGFKMTDIVSVTVYVTSLDDVPKMNEVYKALMPDPKPARATVQVAGLIGGAKIEMSAIAVKH